MKSQRDEIMYKEEMFLSLSDRIWSYATPSGFDFWVGLVCYNHSNPSGLVRYGINADMPKGLAAFKEFCNEIPKG